MAYLWSGQAEENSKDVKGEPSEDVGEETLWQREKTVRGSKVEKVQCVLEGWGVWSGVNRQEVMKLKNLQGPGMQGEVCLLQGVGICLSMGQEAIGRS